MFTGRLARELFSEDVSRVATILCLCSPFLGLLHATHLSHTATALGGVIAWWAGIRMVQTGGFRWGVIAGLVLAIAFLCRPLTAVVCGGCLGLGLLFYVKPAELLRSWKPILAAVLLVLGAVGAQLAFNKASTGDALVAGHVKGLGRRGQMGFVKLDHARTHTVELGVEYSRRRLVAMNQTLSGWPIPTMMLALIPLVFGARRWRAVWLLLPMTGLILLFSTFWYWEEYYPARYVSEAMPYILILAAAGWGCLRDRWKDSTVVLRVIPSTWVAGGILFAVACSNNDLYDYYTPQHGDVENILPQVVDTYGIENALVLMDSVETRFHWDGDQYNNYYTTGFQRNTLTMDGDVVYAWNVPKDRTSDKASLSKRRQALFDTYKGRNYYLYRFDRGADRAWLYTFNVVNGRPTARVPVKPQDGCELLMYTGTPPKDSL